MKMHKVLPIVIFSALFIAGCCGKEAKPVAKEVVAQPAVEGDQDKDGVLDSQDSCPNTPMTAEVDSRGCWVLKGVNFDTNKSTILPGSEAILDKAASVLLKNPGVNIAIDGHTDSVGSENHNNGLSQRRADAVKAYFVKKGVNANQLTTAGYGESKPIASNDTPDGRTLNRRVELSVQK